MVKVTVLGAAGGIGQPLSLMLKLNPYISDLALYDVVNVYGIGTDLSHIDTDTRVTYHLKSDAGDTGLVESLKGSDIVVIPAGVPRKPGMTRDDLFQINAGISADIASAISDTCPDAFVLVITNPVNSIVPVFAETFKKKGTFNPRKLFGVTTLDSVRSNSFIAELASHEADQAPTSYNIRVVGGHAGETIVPLYSVCAPHVYLLEPPEKMDELVHKVQYAGDLVVKAKNGGGSATLSMAYAGYKFLHAVLASSTTEQSIIESTYIYLDDSIPGAKETKALVKSISGGASLDYFAMPVVLSKDGVKEIKSDILTRINDKEKELLRISCRKLAGNIKTGLNFGQ
ncbi:hypothetical protein OGAPHI_000941 [Ogataea philodendri]|uniref:Malate dehydrogenase n=1 Tax=Ogataea philodendri TaxID=1378263 RepID=A0A9P8T929_9ASCO|nr:uncharacterized protein OGAPHI_000941 [Ogataea philodendri]KAH3670426.1 hypothetical protein OGAPHI_000941 [Ogataea philodendri]